MARRGSKIDRLAKSPEARGAKRKRSRGKKPSRHADALERMILKGDFRGGLRR